MWSPPSSAAAPAPPPPPSPFPSPAAPALPTPLHGWGVVQSCLHVRVNPGMAEVQLQLGDVQTLACPGSLQSVS